MCRMGAGSRRAWDCKSQAESSSRLKADYSTAFGTA